MVYQMPKLFPPCGQKNIVIAVSGIGSRNGTSSIMIDTLLDLNFLEAGAQCFPLYLYELATDSNADTLFSSTKSENGYTVRDGITDDGLAHFRTAYPSEKISKEDVFYYIYGLLHSPDYRARYADNLSKQLPRIPCVKKAQDFWAFVTGGRKLGELHVGYESVTPYPVTLDGKPKTDEDYRVVNMKFGTKSDTAGKSKDKTTIVYNSKITLKNIPLEAYDYIVNGKPAIEWVMERQGVKTDKDSGIVNDANLYATETVGDASYPLLLLKRVITVSLETMKLVNALPELDI
jgi:predicted helicase